MSYNIRNIREISNDPLTKFTNQLAKKLAKFLNAQQQQKLENKEDIYSASEDVEAVIKFHSFVSTKKFTFLLPYYPPNEPDNLKCQLWIRGHNMGNSTKDWSETSKTITISGDPLLVDGSPFDSGIHTGGIKSTALRFNRPNQPEAEYYKIEDTNNIRISSAMDTGRSYFIRFKIHSIATQNGFARTLFEKFDESTKDNGVTLQVNPSGRLHVNVKRTGTDHAWETDAGTIAVDTVYDVWVTYAAAGTVKVYVNNVDKSLSAITAPTWHSPNTALSMYVMYRGGDSANGLVYGDLYDFRVYYEKVVSASEVGYMYTNKWTIANIPYGQVMITDYYSTYNESFISYTTGSFTSTSFHTT